MDIKAIEELCRLMKEQGLDTLELSEKDSSIKLHMGGRNTPAPEDAARSTPFAPAAIDGSENAAKSAPGIVVTSPTVGVFYLAPSPESEAFVRVGDKVKKGDTLCIIEAMKLMNEIPSEYDGTIAEVYPSNGQVVEYDQPLFRIV